jgi:transcriptional regulator with XRE-family HTH domain
MSIGSNIKRIREQQGLLQKEVAAELGLDKSSYSKLEKDLREVKVSELQILSGLFSLSIDQIVNFEGDTPKEVTIADKTAVEQLKLISQLDEEDRKTVFTIIDKMLTNQKFKNFFEENVGK